MLCPPPVLHLRLGIVNSLMSELFNVCPELEKQIEKELNVIRKPYHGNAYEGKQTQKILSNLQCLRTHVDDDQSKSVIQVLEHFHAVDQAAFGMVLGNGVKGAVKKFEESYHRHQDEFHGGKKVTGMKVHIVMHQLEQFVTATGKPLGQFNEETVENMHHEFLKVYQSYKVNSRDSKMYKDNLLRCVLHFNSYRI